ncbi:DNA-processing protein DprA [Aliarcobacter skirrowii]|jgi:predicted Rossmann fold nucleotide-binding protein DprA/Smf involved in DNA uptake|uniref:DNA-processing protein DprA n=1 Tax=Aliarcobacter TaxID=2321111 RepID=UPI0021B65433|nr:MULTISPECIES: DNA-processing protein DprA [Aliarcobacter]MCT7497879.1 DNA-protecting protein DprA [Aliarcobacter cryaerophilus]MDX4070952.1 DNA-processing protein DprA [Aliarcobacter skirrowii]
MNDLSLNAQAIILLTAYFNKGDKPLTIMEYSKFASWLLLNNMKPSDLLELNAREVLEDWDDTKITQDRILSLLARGNAMAISLQKWQNCGIWIITRADPEYPVRLKKRLGQKAPPILYGAGNKKILNTKGVAIIGSRDASSDDLNFTFKLGEKLAQSGYSVVSGAARGIDESSMLGSINADGTTIGVVADALMQKVLSKKYRDAIRNNNLILVSPYYPDARFSAGNAMGRNKYIYILAESSIVIHSGLKGGTWEGAKENLKNGWVSLFVKQNDDSNAGNKKLLEMGGSELKDLDSLDYLFTANQNVKTATVSKKEALDKRILELISLEKLTVKEIAEKLEETQNIVKKTIDELLVSGDVEKHPTRPLCFSKTTKLPGL